MTMTTTEATKEAAPVTKFAATASARAWLDALNIAALTLSRKPPLPILAHVLISSSAERVTITSNNYEASITADVAGATGESFDVLLPLRFVVDTIKVIASDKASDVELTVMDFLDRKVAVLASEGFKYPIVAHHSIDEFPRFDSASGPAAFSIAAEQLKLAIKRTTVASSKDRTLPILTGLKFTSEAADSVLRVEATDRYRLSFVREPAYVKRDTSFLIDNELLFKLLPKIKQKQPVSFVVSGEELSAPTIKMIFETFTVSIIGIAGDYPKLKKLFAESYEHSFTADRDALIRSARVAERLSARNTPCTFELLGGTLYLKPNRDGLDSISYGLLSVPAVGITPRASELQQFAVNPLYLLDALKHLDAGEVTISFNSVVKPIVFSNSLGASDDAPFRYLLMPVRMPS
ncbi:DNA polymerase III sliding clamp beta [Arthrobacter phage Wyborn]|uniref:DNA polymerase III sliding clamp beta n=1 Tax=Arthrobacter phage Wyborn TaxID=3059067 RepID=A0AA96GZX6_9CAUD|nr:DNA polymerase III sliding clamp beta [Arthrobacter phage Wyborn]